jgi:hypothetical protein
VAIEAGHRGQGPAFDLDDRDPQARGVENEPLEGLAPLRNHQQPNGRSAGHERLLDGSTSGNELFARIEQARWQRSGRPAILRRPRAALAGGSPRRTGRSTIRTAAGLEVGPLNRAAVRWPGPRLGPLTPIERFGGHGGWIGGRIELPRRAVRWALVDMVGPIRAVIAHRRLASIAKRRSRALGHVRPILAGPMLAGPMLAGPLLVAELGSIWSTLRRSE